MLHKTQKDYLVTPPTPLLVTSININNCYWIKDDFLLCDILMKNINNQSFKNLLLTLIKFCLHLD